MHKKVSSMLWITCLALILMVTGACAPVDTQTTDATAPVVETTGDTEAAQLRIGVNGDEGTLTPYTYVTGYPGWNLLLLQYDSLYQLDAAGAAQPWLASGATTSDDGLTVTLDLREDVTWHDGEAFTAADVAFTVAYFQANTQSRFTRALRPVVSAEATSDYQVVMTLTAPTPLFELSVLADVPILPEHIWAAIEDPAEHAFESVSNVGTGPYQLVEYEQGQFYRFSAYSDYFYGTPTVAELVVIQFADDAGGLAALRTGEVDMLVRSVLPEQIDLLGATGDITVDQGALFATNMLNYDVTKSPFDQLAVREALALAIDGQELIDTVLLGTGTIGSPGWLHPASPFFNDAVTTAYDPEQARALLEEAGITDSDGDGIRELNGEPLAFELITPNDNALRLRMAELIRDMLATELGMEVSVASVEQATWEEAVWPGFDVSSGRNYDMAMWGWSAPVQANAVRITSLVHSDPAIGSLNLTGYASEEMDALAAELNVTVDPDRFATLLDEIQLLIAQDLPFLMLNYPDGAFAYRNSAYDGWVFMAGQGIFHKLSFLPAAE